MSLGRSLTLGMIFQGAVVAATCFQISEAGAVPKRGAREALVPAFGEVLHDAATLYWAHDITAS